MVLLMLITATLLLGGFVVLQCLCLVGTNTSSIRRNMIGKEIYTISIFWGAHLEHFLPLYCYMLVQSSTLW